MKVKIIYLLKGKQFSMHLLYTFVSFRAQHSKHSKPETHQL